MSLGIREVEGGNVRALAWLVSRSLPLSFGRADLIGLMTTFHIRGHQSFYCSLIEPPSDYYLFIPHFPQGVSNIPR